MTLQFWITSSDFLAIVLSMVMPAVLLLIIIIMLVGRLVGVSHVTAAFCWSIVFLVILFPWQVLLGHQVQEPANPATATASTPAIERPEINFPGVLYTFTELSKDFDFPSKDWKTDWSSIVLSNGCDFAGWPAVELIILLMVQARSSRGLRFALGEADVPGDVGVGGGGITFSFVGWAYSPTGLQRGIA